MDRYQQHLKQLAAAAEGAIMHRGLGGVQAEVVFIIDVSKSMFPMYKHRIAQELATELLALSLSFDDDGVIPAYAFGERCRHLGDLTVDDFPGYIDREVIRTGADYQKRCNYAPVIDAVCSYYFPEDWHQPSRRTTRGRVFKREHVLYPRLSAPRAFPVFAMFITSGDCDDRERTTDLIRRSSRLPIFWQFIGLSAPRRKPTRFKFLRKLDRLGNTWVDNCGFFQPDNIWDATSLYDGMLNEFPSYLRSKQVQAMIRPPELGGKTTTGHRPKPGEEARIKRDTALVDEEAAQARPATPGPRLQARTGKRQVPPAPRPSAPENALEAKIARVRNRVADTVVRQAPMPDLDRDLGDDDDGFLWDGD